jgi:hypothetical protein
MIELGWCDPEVRADVDGGGLAWLVAGIVGAFVGAIVNAWVLLVEILR